MSDTNVHSENLQREDNILLATPVSELERKRTYDETISPCQVYSSDTGSGYTPPTSRWKGSPSIPESAPKSIAQPGMEQTTAAHAPESPGELPYIDIGQLILSAVSSPNVVQALTTALVPVLKQLIDHEIKPISDKIEAQTSEFNKMKSSLQSQISQQNKVIESLSKENAALKGRVRQNEESIDELSDKLDDLEQYGRRTSLRFHGVPVDKSKSTDDIVVALCNDKLKVDPPITLDDINRSHTIGKSKDGKCQIICKFRNWKVKTRVFKCKKVLKDLKSDEFSVFISEDPTRQRQHVIKSLKAAYSAGRVHSYWTNDGRIFAKATEEGEKLLIKCRSDVDNFFPEFAESQIN